MSGYTPDGALLHPLGILVFLAVQWYALGRQLLGRPAGWKGRDYSTSSADRPLLAGDPPQDARLAGVVGLMEEDRAQ